MLITGKAVIFDKTDYFHFHNDLPLTDVAFSLWSVLKSSDPHIFKIDFRIRYHFLFHKLNLIRKIVFFLEESMFSDPITVCSKIMIFGELVEIEKLYFN